MTPEEATVGMRIRTTREYSRVPEGTEGVIDEDYVTGVMVAWDLPESPLPSGYREYDGVPMIISNILRDGFDKKTDLEYLQAVQQPGVILWMPYRDGLLVGRVRAKDFLGEGYYHFTAQKRPAHCDRGQWLLYIKSEGVAALDDHEGFPRYYFSEENMKDEMAQWVQKRDTCQKQLWK